MNIKELLNMADKVVYESTGRHLTDLQSDLLKASYENQTYEQFANDRGYCLDYIKKDVGSLLWNLLSQALGEKITKKNFRQALERYQQTQEILNYKEKKKRQDFSDVPNTSAFLERTEEFGKLRQWILQDKCRLVAFVSFREIDKTSLAAKLVTQIEDEFEQAIWRSQLSTEPLASPLGELVPFLPNQQEAKTQIRYLLQCLCSSHCLLILDNVEAVLQIGKLARNDSEGYGEYSYLA
ncbi:hypothetical protein [Fischerella sp. PCC 9605]|uniref:hypothetical protein n=1 Tax=Fischerella sp. PCC 9605 TaxID=1173024 RepID=UPI00047A6A9A|nr:hypothetical protein [Fischerella sp. PCC 9605]